MTKSRVSLRDDEVVVSAAASAPVTSALAVAAKAELAKMKKSLVGWLKYRGINDQIAGGQAGAVPTPLLRRPGAAVPSAAVMAIRLRRDRADDEIELATQLHALLSEVFDAASLPDPDVTKNPQAAVQLAQIAISGALPGTATAPGAQGFIWMWPLVIVIGAIAFVTITAIRSAADSAEEKERLACIEAGKCTDTGFWIKVGALAVAGWVVWDKMGVGHRVTGMLSGKRTNPSRRRRSYRRAPYRGRRRLALM